MKKLLFILGLLVALSSCKTEPKKDYIVIKGTIQNKKGDNLKVTSLCYADSKNLTLNADGSFVDTLNVTADNIMLYHGGNLTYMYVEAGDELTITFDTNDYENTLQFSGTGARYNNYLLAKQDKTKEVLKGKDNIYLLGEQEFKLTQKQLEDTLQAFLNETTDIPEAFKAKEKRNITYGYLNALGAYRDNHRYYTKNNDFEVSSTFLEELEKLDYNSYQDFIFSNAYRGLMADYCSEIAKNFTDSLGMDSYLAYMKALNTLSNKKIKNILSYSKAKYAITYTGDVEAYYAEYLKASQDEVHNKEITESYLALKTVAKGKPSPKFESYENIDGTTTSLDDLKGKYVYIDVWATWCGPCKGEIPFLKEVEKQYHDKNIEFVSISLDTPENKEKWKNMVEQEQLKGVQLLADNAFKSQFVEEYFIKGIPRFILIDPQGMIVTANAPRPSNKRLVDLFNDLSI